MGKIITLFVALFLFLLGGCATFRGLQEDSRLAYQKVKNTFTRGKSATPQQIRAAQSRLKARGYHSGSVDGLMGPQTVTALRRYQSANDLSVTGKVNEETLKSLGLN